MAEDDLPHTVQEETTTPGGSGRTEPAVRDTTGRTVVGIGASAGGLSALKTFFDNVPADSNLTFVVVTHLSEEHKSHLADLLQIRAHIPVQQVTGNAEIRPNEVYVIPPGYNLSAIDTHLRLVKLEDRRAARAPIDHFFCTLATSFDGHAIGVILTGTGTDGSQGVKEVKAKGGMVLVQDPNEAEYDGMPQSAISTGMVDLVLPVAQIPGALQKIIHNEPRITVPEDGKEIDGKAATLLRKVFSLLRLHTGRDYSHYKPSTSLRRIARRMQINSIDNLPAYLERLRRQSPEIRALADDLLITVTNFFRDAEAYHALEKDVIPKLFDDAKLDTVRIWSVGCSTGEEAYSLAILLVEEAARRETPFKLQVFATDIHEASLARAREGFYPADIETNVSPERLQRFFQKQNEGYRIRREVRELIVFSQHNVLEDPPFSRMNLISCRNLLIYLQPKVQDEVIELFHYACNPHGYLLLGPSETIRHTDLFRPVDKAQKILEKRNVPAPEPHLPVFPWTKASWNAAPQSEVRSEDMSYSGMHTRLMAKNSLPSALVGPEDKALHLSESVGRYLVHPGGEITPSIVKLVRGELRAELLVALHTARARRRSVVTKPIFVQFDGSRHEVVLRVHPAQTLADDGFLLVAFDERQEPAPTDKESADLPLRPAMERDLENTHQQLQSVIDQYESSQEEMKASNEELQSTNEELRSTLEELETSKEELQSMNEELQTVNQENRHKVEELGLLSSDLQNLLSATDIATLFLDREYRILRFTSKVSELFNIRMMDRGRPLSDITHRLGDRSIVEDAQRVLEHLTPIERELEDQGGKWYLMRIRPYRSSDERIDGVVVTFVDITSRKQMEMALKKSDEQLKEFAVSLERRIEERTQEVRELAAQKENTQRNERSRIAQVLHDDLQQLLFAASMTLESRVESEAAEHSGVAPEDEVLSLIKDAIRVVRELTTRLMPTDPTLSFTLALRQLANEMQITHGLEVRVQANRELNFQDHLAETVYTAVRELLFNVVKHAGVKTAEVEADRNEKEFWIRVADQGRGFDPAAPAKETGYGFAFNRTQLAAINVTLDVQSAPGSGTTVTLRGSVDLLK